MRTTKELEGLRAVRDTLLEGEVPLRKELADLKERHVDLLLDREQVTKDRDNLFAQVKRVLQERDAMEAERETLTEAFRQAAAERLELLDHVAPLETMLADLQERERQLAAEREQLTRQIEETKGRNAERTLRNQLGELKRKESDLSRAMRQTKKELEHASRQEQQASAQLAKLTERMEALQSEYTEEVSENAELRRNLARLPKDVTTIAREHERLLKDLADTHYNMGVSFAKQRDYGRAAKEFLRVVELRPTDADAHFNLGLIYAEHLPDRERAIEYFNRYLTVDPKGRDAAYAKQYIAAWRAWEGQEHLVE